MSRWRWILQDMTKRLWLRATLIGALGVLAAVFALVAERFIPWELPATIRADAVDSILTIIASSMLAVTTFTLSVMTSAYGSATSNVTPRATKLLMEDGLTQNVLSTFIGAFLFGIVGIVVLKTGAYGDRGRVVLFAVTIGVIALIVIMLLRWIDHLTRLGRVGETTNRVEDAASQAIAMRLAAPYLGGHPLVDADGAIPAGATPVLAARIGYLQHIDMPALSACADAYDTELYVVLNPGAFVYDDTVLAWIGPYASEDREGQALQDAAGKAFTIGIERSFDQDPRFGLAVMSEIASRALSPATNDPGTAIDVIGRTTRLMRQWGQGPEQGDTPVAHPRVYVVPLKDEDLFEDAFMLMARDGAGLVEVQLRLQKALAALSRLGSQPFRQAARRQATLALRRSEATMTMPQDIERVREMVAMLLPQDAKE